jgi:hypothetical protein
LILTVEFSNKKIKRVKSNVIRLTYLLFLLMAYQEKCYCFLTFKDLWTPRFARNDKPFFQTECKGKGPFISTKFSGVYFYLKTESFGMKINLFVKN